MVAFGAIDGRDEVLVARRGRFETGAEPSRVTRRDFVSYAFRTADVGKMARLRMVDRGVGLDAIDGTYANSKECAIRGNA